MAVKVAINGFGRIGRMTFRALIESGRKDVEVVAINDLASDIVFECTGIFTEKEKAQVHLDAGAKRVLVSAPAKGADLTVVYGVNQDKITSDMRVFSNASCTTNCLAPVVEVLNRNFGISHGYMTTIHSYTGDQVTLDRDLKGNLYRSRAAAQNIIPTTTGAAKAIGLVIPELAGKLDGASTRVPTPDVSLVDFKFVVKKDSVTAEEINNAIIEASKSDRYNGILCVNTDALVSSDFIHNPASSTFDLKETKVMEGNFVRIVSWYDNEWGFSNRMLDTAVAIAKTI